MSSNSNGEITVGVLYVENHLSFQKPVPYYRLEWYLSSELPFQPMTGLNVIIPAARQYIPALDAVNIGTLVSAAVETETDASKWRGIRPSSLRQFHCVDHLSQRDVDEIHSLGYSYLYAVPGMGDRVVLQVRAVHGHVARNMRLFEVAQWVNLLVTIAATLQSQRFTLMDEVGKHMVAEIASMLVGQAQAAGVFEKILVDINRDNLDMSFTGSVVGERPVKIEVLGLGAVVRTDPHLAHAISCVYPSIFKLAGYENVRA